MILDGIFVAFTLISAVLAMVRGFSREALSIASWVAAAVAAYYFYPNLVPVIQPYLQPYTTNLMVTAAVAAAIIFLVVLIIATIITMKIADLIIDSRIGALDRTLGFLFGAARGVLVVAVGLLFFTSLAASNQPAWITEAKSRPLLQSVGTWIEGLMPKDLDKLMPSLPGGETPADNSAETPAEEPPQQNPPAANN